MTRRLTFHLTVVALFVLPTAVQAQELLTNGGLELVFPDVGGRDSVAPGWKIEEGPLVPELPGPYPGDYNNGGVPSIPCPTTGCGAVDAADYTVWRDHLGQTFQLPNEVAGTSTGSVTNSDYVQWKNLFGGPNLLSMAETSNFQHLLLEGDWQMWFQPYNSTRTGNAAAIANNFAHLTQTVPGTPGLQYTMTGWALFEDYFPGGVVNLNMANPDGTPTDAPFDDGPLSPTDTFFALEFLNSTGDVLAGSVVKELKADGQPSNTTWMQHTLSATAPAGTTNVRVRASMINGIANPLPSPQIFQMSFFVDAFSLTATAGSGSAGSVPEPATWVLCLLAVGANGAWRHGSRLRR